VNLPLLSGWQVLTALTRLGFHEVGRKGSHVKMVHADGRRIVFPFHNEIDRYTLRGALREAEIDVNEFLAEVRS
jgi:predicted RNA binding protein YcfA (HicA-like mRNA interferase family)